MKPYQRQFIEFALSKQVLKFGEFTLKSGRKSPYFFNAGLFNTGRDLALLGRFYAEALVDSGIEFDLLFGPAYKGIPIATTTAVALAEHIAGSEEAFVERMNQRAAELGMADTVFKNACGLPVDAKVVQIDLSGPQVLVSEHFLRPVRVVKVRGHEVAQAAGGKMSNPRPRAEVAHE